MKISGIYQVQSKVKPERIYIGSTKNIYLRWNEHLRRLKKGDHHSKKLQSHFNKYSIADLSFSILLACDKEDLIKTEQYFIDAYNPWFNCCPIAGSQLGIKRSPETNKKHSDILKGRILYKQTDESKQKNKESQMGHIVTLQTREKISNTLKGKKHTEERRNNISRSLIGKLPTRGNTGMKHSIEHRNKISEGMKKNHGLRKLKNKRYAS